MRFGSIRLFRLFDIRIELHFTFLLLLAGIGVLGYVEAGWLGLVFSLAAVCLIFTCVLLHELGHCVAAQRYGIDVPRILLMPIGGMAQFERIPREPWRELVITAAGPAVNFVLAGGLFLVFGFPSDWSAVAGLGSELNLGQMLAVVNLLMGTFNLLPVFPMDGGRIFRALMAYRCSYLGATRAAVIVGKVLAVVGIFLALWQFENFLAAALFAFIFIGGDAEYRVVRRQELFGGLRVGDLVHGSYASIPASATIADASEAFREVSAAELLVLNGDGQVVGLLNRSAVRRPTRAPFVGTEPVGNRMLPVTRVLQAHWPLEILGDAILSGQEGVYPVYQGHVLRGILDTRQLHQNELTKMIDRRRADLHKPRS